MAYIIDTSVLIDFLRGDESATSVIREGLKRKNTGVSVITVLEIFIGVQPDSKREGKLIQLFKKMTVYPLDMAAIWKAIEVERRLRRGGSVIGLSDTLIAGTCLSNNCTLITYNIRHFERVEELRVLLPPEVPYSG